MTEEFRKNHKEALDLWKSMIKDGRMPAADEELLGPLMTEESEEESEENPDRTQANFAESWTKRGIYMYEED